MNFSSAGDLKWLAKLCSSSKRRHDSASLGRRHDWVLVSPTIESCVASA